MGAWFFVQVLINLGVLAGLFVVAARVFRTPKEDPRLTRGLQVLQSKISVLEDLSDRTEAQVQELSSLLDQKARHVQSRIEQAESQIQKIRAAMHESLEVAKIFQDKIPHQEIIERQNTVKYVKAARLAHQGLSADEIARQVDLPRGEIDFIAKINRDGLVFDEAALPVWIKSELGETTPPTSISGVSADPVVQRLWLESISRGAAAMSADVPGPVAEVEGARSVDMETKLETQVLGQATGPNAQDEESDLRLQAAKDYAKQMASVAVPAPPLTPEIKKVVFRKIDMPPRL